MAFGSVGSVQVRFESTLDGKWEKLTPEPIVKATSTRGTQVLPDELSRIQSDDQATAGQCASPSSLFEVLDILSTERDQLRRRIDLEARLQHTHVATARAYRLHSLVPAIRRTFADCIRFDDKANFARLCDTVRDCFADILAFNETIAGHGASEGPGTKVPFVDALPDEIKHEVVNFLGKIRFDGDFLYSSLAALDRAELSALLPYQGVSRPAEFVFASSPRYGTHRPGQFDSTTEGQLTQLAREEFGSPLETLILSIRNPSFPLCDTDVTETWATVCSKMIVDQKPGSEKFVPAIVDMWSSWSHWHGKDKLELWIIRTLQDGEFLTRRPYRQKPTFRMRVEGQHEFQAPDDLIREEYYSKAVDSLLDLLGDPQGPSVIPSGALEMCACICEKLNSSPGYLKAFPSFIATRWLVPSLLPDILTLPEMYGMAQDSFISHNARQLILREITSRIQKVLLDTLHSSKSGTRPSPEMIPRLKAILDKFGADTAPGTNAHETIRLSARKTSSDLSLDFAAVSAPDVVTIIKSLHPPRRPLSAHNGQIHLTPQSSSSSFSGLSVFIDSAASLPSDSTAVGTPNSVPDISSGTETPQATEPFAMTGDELVAQLDMINPPLREACDMLEGLTKLEQSNISPWTVLVVNSDKSLETLGDNLVEAEESFGKRLRDHQPRSKSSSSIKTIVDDLFEAGLDDRYREGLEDSAFADPAGLYNRRSVHEALEACITLAEQHNDFLAAEVWSQHSITFNNQFHEDNRAETLRSIVDNIVCEARDSHHRLQGLANKCESWIAQVQTCLTRRLVDVQRHDRDIQLLRSKMWYVADVRGSTPYDDASSVASALFAMGHPKTQQTSRQMPGSLNWGNTRPTRAELLLKTEAQVVELLSAKTRHGGPNKLNDDQIRALTAWMTRNRIENLCAGEERLHKLCMDIQKCIDRLLADMHEEKAAIWSNDLFKRDANLREKVKERPLPIPSVSRSLANLRGIRTQQSNDSVDKASVRSLPLSSASSKDYFSANSAVWTLKSSAPFWSPAQTNARTPSSATSIPLSNSKPRDLRRRYSMLEVSSATMNEEQTLEEQLRQHLTTLLLSDLAGSFFKDGSETDCSYWSGLGGYFTEKHCRAILSEIPKPLDNRQSVFQYQNAFKNLLQKFSTSWSPFAKLRCLHQIDELLKRRIKSANQGVFVVNGQAIPESSSSQDMWLVSSDNSIGGFRLLFADSSIRPPHIFRDLQFIAALVPKRILDSTPEGRAFWNATVGIFAVRQEARNVMVETADRIISYISNNRGYGGNTSSFPSSSSPTSPAQETRDRATFNVSPTPRHSSSAPEEDIAKYTMADAGALLQIAAKEGDHVAQRELATMYLTHPDLLPRIIAPLVPPRSVFTEALETKWRRNQDSLRCDPATMCLAHHWMRLSSNGGDALAKEFLKQGEEIEKLP